MKNGGFETRYLIIFTENFGNTNIYSRNILLFLNEQLLVERYSLRLSNSRTEHSWLGTKSVVALSAQ